MIRLSGGGRRVEVFGVVVLDLGEAREAGWFTLISEHPDGCEGYG
jgi:hypothetical protein